MFNRVLYVALVVLFVAHHIPEAASQRAAETFLDQADRNLVRWNGTRSVASGAATGKKSCAEVYPVPEAAKNWTQCKTGQFSQCGGPEECTCPDKDDRLIFHDCKEGSYAICEDDHTCLDNCRY
jgi:hypothetical protein